ncbi:MAG: anaerobic ribonucleoside-triphosphate reductase activating protein [Synergistaceae bacterium]|jgi:anaerobic ribonucleoside-triphosphate reductase activating protein|nr:anaerobic ribonucleoside-triphosphate reductase activating protein [Synergistaceae bacterium]
MRTETKLRIAGLVDDSITDGPGLRLAVFSQGCLHRCRGCHNPATHDPGGGYEVDVAAILAALDANPLLDGITLTGGEPFLQAFPLAELARGVKRRGLSVWTYTGYRWEELMEEIGRGNAGFAELLKHTDVLVDGRHEQEARSLSLSFRGSSNQRLVDVPRSLTTARVVELYTQNSRANYRYTFLTPIPKASTISR